MRRIIEIALQECREDSPLTGHPAVNKGNLKMAEQAAYGLLLRGDADASLQLLKRVEAGAEDGGPGPAWVAEMTERASKMRSLIENGEISAAVAKLELWLSQSVAALGLELG